MGNSVIPIGIGMVVGGTVGWLLNLLFYWFWLGGRHSVRKSYAVHPKFRDAYRAADAAGIGNPIGNADTGEHASWQCFEGAYVLWLRNGARSYQLPFDHSDRKVRRVTIPLIPDDSPYHDPNHVRDALGLPRFSEPPLGGIALAWKRDPRAWDWIGGKQSWCRIMDDGFLVQRFENGLMVGCMPVSPDGDERAVVWLVEGGDWGMLTVK